MFCAPFGDMGFWKAVDCSHGKACANLPQQRFPQDLRQGEKLCLPLVVVYALKNRTKNVRVGITTSKKVGNAVQRNRSRRVIREAFRALAPRVRPGFDLVLVARGKTPYVKSTDVRRQLERQLQAAGLLREETP